jgi:predicted ArsR family transcriptional regulator
MDSTRQRVLDTLLATDTPMTVARLAAVIGVHRTSVGQHLRHLLDVGAVSAVPIPPQGRGRPSTGYVAIDPAPYRTLAGWLAAAAGSDVPPREVGRDIGQRLASDRVDGDPVRAIEREATRLGFRPHRRDRGERIELRFEHCPYADVAADDLDVVCQLHLGLAEGIATRSAGVTVEDLRVADPHRGGCRLQLRRVSR